MNTIKEYGYGAVILFLFFGWTQYALASFEITEIMYDLDGTDTNREWVEVHNTGSTDDDLSKWYLFSDNTKHALVPQGVSTVAAGGYAVIVQDVAKFQIDWPNYTGLLFDSSWTGFSNDTETIGLKDKDLNLVGSVTISSSMGGAGDGNSLQKSGSTFVGATPTPGVATVSLESSPAAPVATSSGSASFGGAGGVAAIPPPPIVKKKEVEIPKITTDILVKNTVVAGLNLSISANTLGLLKEPLASGRFVWNFGDGTSRTDTEYKPFTYIYEYPGEYLLTLSYYRNYNYSFIPDATDRVVIKVVEEQASISSVGGEANPYIELENKSNIELDLSGWKVKGVTHTFTITDGTILLPGSKLKLSPRVTAMTFADVQAVSLLNPHGDTVSTYPERPVVMPKPTPDTSAEVKSKSVTTTATLDKSNITSQDTKAVLELKKTTSTINLNTLTASAAGALPSKDNKNNIDSGAKKTSSSPYAYIGFLGVLIAGASATMVLQKKGLGQTVTSQEEPLHAEDITILE
jgi:Lamin Tail Domain/PKD domain